MNDVLARIAAYKREEIARAKLDIHPDEMEARAFAEIRPRDFLKAIRTRHQEGRPALIAEIKKMSPSKGMIRADFDPRAIARAYEDGGAACLSVLTDGPSFGGRTEDLVEARRACFRPALRKDFMFDPYQVFEARTLGADCILVIMAAVTDDEAQALIGTAQALFMDVLVEVHDEAELERALRLEADLIGINNRDLRTFQTTLAVSERLAPLVPKDRIVVAESGIATPTDIARLRDVGVNTFLVGESLMRQKDIREATRRLLAPSSPPKAEIGLTHLDRTGAAHMVDVSEKAVTARLASAEGCVVMQPATVAIIRSGDAKKGDVLGTARLAGIMAAKRTHDLIPLCHPLLLSRIKVECEIDDSLPGVRVAAEVSVTGQTGVEMEALTAVSVACLTLYDMVKAADREMRIEGIRLLAKSGGRSGTYKAG